MQWRARWAISTRDNLNDLAVALDDGVRLFRNLGKGKFRGRDDGGGT